MRGAIYHFSIAPVVDAVPLHTLHQPRQSYGIARRDYQPDIRSLSQEQQQHLLADTSNISVLARLLLPFCLAFT
jgi:hypothetical protein